MRSRLIADHLLQQLPTPVPGNVPVPPQPDPGQPAPVEDPADDPAPPLEDPGVADPNAPPSPPPMIA